MIIGTLMDYPCPICRDVIEIAEYKSQRKAYCPSGGDFKKNKHTLFGVGEALEHRVAYINPPEIVEVETVEEEIIEEVEDLEVEVVEEEIEEESSEGGELNE